MHHNMRAEALSSGANRLALARAELLRGWQRGDCPSVETLLGSEPALASDSAAVVDLVHLEAILRQLRGQAVDVAEYARRFPDQAESIQLRFQLDGQLQPAPLVVGSDGDPDATVAPSPLPPARSDLPAVPGYEVLEEIGRGGMGVVYKARHLALNRIVALKMILAGQHAGAAELDRFRTEAQAIARLSHPHIVQVYEVGEHERRPFLSLEYCAGGSLEKQLNGAPLLPVEAAELVATLARAMEAAHRAGVVHRDLKPANVLVGQAFQPDSSSSKEVRLESLTYKITDFGLAKRLDDLSRTQTGAVLGTPSYMAPEQAQGKKDVGPSADIYALGAILYECLTGQPPFRAASVLDTLLLVMEREPPSPRQLNGKVPRDLETICLKCLQKEPRQRYASAAELADDLTRFLHDEPIRARPPSPLRKLDRWVRRRQGLVLAWGGALLLGLLLAVLLGVPSAEAVGLKRERPLPLILAVLPVVLLMVRAAAVASLRAAAVALVPAALACAALWWLVPALRAGSGLEMYLFAAALAAALALLVGVGWARRPPEALALFVALLVLGWVAGTGAFLHGVTLAFFVRLVAWALIRDAAGVALGALIGAVAGLVLVDQYGLRLRTLLYDGWPQGWSVPSIAWIGLYLEGCLAFLGAVAGGLLGPRPVDYPGLGDQVVPSQNRTPTRSTSAAAVPAGHGPGS
jgi:hypothetical protein